MTSGTTTDLFAVWGSAGNKVYVAGDLGVMRRFNGAAWIPFASGTMAPLMEVRGLTANEFYTVGSGGTVVRYLSGSPSATTLPTVQ